MRFKALALTVMALTVCTASHAALVTNGGFETGDFSGWDLTGKVNIGFYETVCANGSSFGGTTCTASSGNYAAALGPNGPSVDLSQNVATTPGAEYVLKFYLRNENLDQTPDNFFNVNFGGTNVFSSTNSSTFGLTAFTINDLVATSATTSLDFIVQNVPGGFFLDDVSLSAVPEPASVLLVAGALGAIGLIRRKRKVN
jgi:hypothetical protein